ncbi:MAG: cysteine peptidase family C39 domain-containing protein [Fusobacteriaceae bacterium]
MEYIHTMQSMSNDCGIAVLKTVLKALEINSSNIYKKIRGEVADGLSLSDLQQVLLEYGIQADAYHVFNFKELEKRQCPIIAVSKREGLNHYIVIHKMQGNVVTVSDPGMSQINEVSYENFSSIFGNYALCIEKYDVNVKKITENNEGPH